MASYTYVTEASRHGVYAEPSCSRHAKLLIPQGRLFGLRRASSHDSSRDVLSMCSGGLGGGPRGPGAVQAFTSSYGDDGGSGRRPHRRASSTIARAVWATLAAAAAQLVLLPSSARAAAWGSRRKQQQQYIPGTSLTVEQLTQLLWDVAGPVLTNLGFSGCLGIAAGIAFKKIGQLVACLIGLGFVVTQALVHTGYLTVNWSDVGASLAQALDLRRDGRLDAADFRAAAVWGLDVLCQGVPSVGGFLGGFYLGLTM